MLVNLASNEYFGVVNTKALGAKVISPRFLDDAPQSNPDELKVISFFAKQARGAMASWLVRERIRSPRKAPGVHRPRVRYDPARSTPSEPTFVRTGASTKPTPSARRHPRRRAHLSRAGAAALGITKTVTPAPHPGNIPGHGRP